MTWFGSWISDGSAEATAEQDIQEQPHGNRNALAQIAVFRLDPLEYGPAQGRRRLLSR